MTAAIDELLAELEQVTGQLSACSDDELPQMVQLMNRRQSVIERLAGNAETNLLNASQAQRARIQMAGGSNLAERLRATATECRGQLRDLYRESVLLQALTPPDEGEPTEINCQG